MRMEVKGFLVTLLWSLLVRKCYCVFESSSELQLYTDLFANYKPLLKPVTLDDKQIQVQVGFTFRQVEKLNELDQKMVSHGLIVCNWRDDVLRWNLSDYNNKTFLVLPANNIWLPDITPINSAESSADLSSMGEESRARVYYTGDILWIVSLKWTTLCEIDVTNFPYDTQHCQIEYASWMYTINMLNFTDNPAVDLLGYTANPEWELVEATAWTEQMVRPAGNLPQVIMKVSLRRDPTYYLVYLVLPSILMSVMMVPMFILPVESGEKISLGVTMMLSFAIFLLMMTDITPRSSKTPKFSIFIIICTVFCGIATITNILIANIHYHSPEKPVPRWIKRLVLVKLAKLLCCMNYATEDNYVKDVDLDERKVKTDDIGTLTITKTGKKYSKDGVGGMQKVTENLEFFKTKTISHGKIEENRSDWNKVARVIDRLNVYFYIILLICFLIVFFGS